MRVIDPSPPKTRFQILIKLVDEWKGENELKLRELVKEYQNDPYITVTKDLDFVTKEGLYNNSIENCNLFIKMINHVSMLIPPNNDYYYYFDDNNE